MTHLQTDDLTAIINDLPTRIEQLHREATYLETLTRNWEAFTIALAHPDAPIDHVTNILTQHITHALEHPSGQSYANRITQIHRRLDRTTYRKELARLTAELAILKDRNNPNGP